MKNIKVHVACVPDFEKQIKQVFLDCLVDYSKRFNAPITTDKVNVHICFIEYPDPYTTESDDGLSHGLTIYQTDPKKVLIQVRDPFLNDWEDNFYVVQQFLCIMCHEFVHACQHLTGRSDPKGYKIKFDKADSRERYMFDPAEIEARLLEVPYFSMYCQKLL